MDNSYRRIFDIMNAKNHRDDCIKKKYYIKTYQRGYRWGIHQINCLLNDIYINYKKYHEYLKKEESKGYEYCLQPLVLKEEPHDDNAKEVSFSVIDGQQRLTTLSLIFKALNSLEEIAGDKKKDEIVIEYDRNETKDILVDICEKCKNIESFDIKGLSLIDLVNLFDDDSEVGNAVYDNQRLKLNRIISDAGKNTNIDGKFMVNAYIYLYLYFKIIINEKCSEESYFAFLHNENNDTEDYSEARVEQLRNLYKYFTTIIWYEPLKNRSSEKTEEEIFEDFNSRKIPLTKSELVKALFMNPDNYIKEGEQDYNNEAIKTKQIMIGIRWDEIEKELHDNELWHFFPHFDEWHAQTRFDAIIDYFVYCECYKRNGGKNIEKLRNYFETDKLYAFKQLEKWIKNDLKNTKKSSEKAEIIKIWWERICSTYNNFSVYFQPSQELVKIFHRISLLQWMNREYFTSITHGSKGELYFSQLEINRAIFKELESVSNNKKVAKLNEKIIQEIDLFFKKESISNTFSVDGIKVNREKCTNIETKIKALSYNSDNALLQAFLMIFSLHILESNVGFTSRFSFYLYFLKEETKNKEDWIIEHIFARGTNLEEYNNKSFNEQKELINTIINCDWREYVIYKFGGVLQAQEIDSIIQRKERLIELMKQLVDDGKNNIEEDIATQIFMTPDGYDADYIKPKYENDFYGLLIEFLKDNSMGNTAILTRADNTSVSKENFETKKERIIKRINMGKFVPIATINMFTGTYCKKGFSAEHWYPCHRKIYLEKMIEAVKKYLEN